MVVIKKRRLVNPERKPKIGNSRAARKTPKQTNPGSLYLLGTVNPQRGKTTVKKSNPKKHKKPARKSNPFPFAHAKKAAPVVQFKHKAKKRKKNPNGELLRMPIDVAKFGALALGGLVVTRQLPQFALQDKNTGAMGYLANFGVAIVAGLATGHFLGKQAGTAVGIGGGLYLVNRFLTEEVSPVGKFLALSGVGDCQAAASMGRLKDAYFPFPVVYDKTGNPVIPKQIDAQAVRAMLPAPVAAGSKVSGVSPRMRGRFAA